MLYNFCTFGILVNIRVPHRTLFDSMIKKYGDKQSVNESFS